MAADMAEIEQTARAVMARIEAMTGKTAHAEQTGTTAETRQRTYPKKRARARRPRPNKSDDRHELKLCTAYLYRKDGCVRGDHCNSLHICRHYILQSCKAGAHCKFSHDLTTRQSQVLFQKRFGIKRLDGQMLIKFRELFAATIRNPQRATSDESSEPKKQQEEDRRFHQEKLKQFLFGFTDVDETSTGDGGINFEDDDEEDNYGLDDGDGDPDSDEEEEKPDKQATTKRTQPQQDRQLKICSFYLHGNCKFSSHQGFRHCSSPYQWQIRNSVRSHWLDLTRKANDEIEEKFCDVNNREYSGAVLVCSQKNMDSIFHVVTITFGVESFGIFDERGQVLDVRRLSTVSSGQTRPGWKGHRTHWTWYWQDNKKTWIKFPPEDDSYLTGNSEVEKNFLNYKNNKGPYQLEVTTVLGKCQLDFSCMKQTSYVRGHAQIQQVARRPKWNRESLRSHDVQSDTNDKKANQISTSAEQKEPKQSLVPKKSKVRSDEVPSKDLQDIQASQESADHPTGHSLNQEGQKNARPKTKKEDHDESVCKASFAHQVVRPKMRNSSGCQPFNTDSAEDEHSHNQKEFIYICPYFLRSRCIHQDNKYKHKRHFPNPYQWQYLDTTAVAADWQNFPSDVNDNVERSFCDVNKREHRSIFGYAPIESISFDRGQMHGSTANTLVRRLTTSSSVLKSNWEEAFCTEWVWYWQDETGSWIVYSEQNAKGIKAGIDSVAIEQKFMKFENKSGEQVIEFTAGQQQYKLDFTAMQQTNVRYGTCRKVERRPKFVSMTERKRLARELSQAQTSGIVVPTTWDKRGNQSEIKKITLMDCANQEYTLIANLFWDTMEDKGNIISIQRIQNMELWEDFSKMKERMKKKNGGRPVLQKQLFHGTTTSTYADAICHQNFDWRLSGASVGTLYGKGSYFARDAKFAHSYTKADDLNHRYVFVAQVLIGTYATGQSDFTRPPPRDLSKPHGDLYDSCVNDMLNPTIFVVFEKMQVYPEYLIKYKDKSSSRMTQATHATYNWTPGITLRQSTASSAHTTGYRLQKPTPTPVSPYTSTGRSASGAANIHNYPQTSPSYRSQTASSSQAQWQQPYPSQTRPTAASQNFGSSHMKPPKEKSNCSIQ